MMHTGKSAGMQIMDECIQALLQEGKITVQSAQKYANDPKFFEKFLKKEKK
jgi:Tfp pilus assembly pilus retraction ATPase PilT